MAIGNVTLLQWLSNAASRGPALHVGVSYMAGEDALYAGWDALHEAIGELGHSVARTSLRVDPQPGVSSTSMVCPFLRASTGEDP